MVERQAVGKRQRVGDRNRHVGLAISAITEPSIISTIEWMTLCG